LNGHSKPVSEQQFRNKNGAICSAPVENAQPVKDHFQNVYNIKRDWDQDAVKNKADLFTSSYMTDDDPPTLKENHMALNSAK